MTYEIAKTLIELRNAETRMKVLAKEPGMPVDAKTFFRHMATRITATLNYFKTGISSKSSHIVNQEMLDDEVSLQLDSILTLSLALPKGIRDQAEAYIKGLYDVYALNKPDANK